MMRRIGLRALLLCAGLQIAPTALALERTETVALGASVYRVEVPATRRGYGIGSGVAIEAERIVTNCHVVGDAETMYVVRGGVRWVATALARDRHHDLCLLSVPGLAAPPVRLGRSADLRPGQPVTAIGFTGGAGIQVSEGTVVQLHPLDGARVIQSSNWFSSGASGGALFDEQGRLVGVLTFRLRGGANHYFSAPVEWLAQASVATCCAGPAASGPRPAAADTHFWQDVSAAQPRFLKVAMLQLNSRWVDLESLATDWARNAPEQAEPWALLGTALEQQGRLPEARTALACSLRLDPGDALLAERLATLAESPAQAHDAGSRLPACPREQP
jgi:serine protease Do